jgi:hypothetical protein
MNRSKGIFLGSTVIPAAIAILALVFLVFLIGPSDIEVSGAEYYNVQSVTGEKVSGLYQGPISNGDGVTNGDVINITAINSTAPSSIPTDDILVVNIIVNNSLGATRYQTSWSLTYNGTGSEFTGNITVNVGLSQDYELTPDGIKLRVEDGYNITLRKYNTNDAPLLHFKVDFNGPSISAVEPRTEVATYEDVFYAKSGGNISLAIDDLSTDQQWMIDQSKISYHWDASTPTVWEGSNISIPLPHGIHTLNVSASDKFGQSTTWLKDYNVSDFLTDPAFSTHEFFSDGLLFISRTDILRDASLTLHNVTLVFINNDDDLKVREGGTLLITNSTITSTGDSFTISSREGGDMKIINTEVYGSDLASSDSSIFSLMTGDLINVTMHEISNRVSILSQDVTLSDSIIELDGSASVYVDMNHTWSKDPAILMNLTIGGTSATPIQITNVSVWTPYDVDTRYYLDGTSGVSRIYLDTSNIINPYLRLPYFLDSRHSSAILDLQYNNSGTWTSFTGFPKSNITHAEWINGDDSLVDLSGLTAGPYEIQVTWTVPSEGVGCVFLGSPSLGGDGIAELKPGSPSMSIDFIEWDKIGTGNVLVMKNISIEDATSNFIHVRSSGDVSFSEISLGSPESAMLPSDLIKIEDSSVTISDSDIVGGSQTKIAVNVNFSAGNDWSTTYLDSMDISINGTGTLDTGIYTIGGWIDLEEVTISNSTTGIKVVEGFINSGYVDIDPEMYGIQVMLPSSYPVEASISIGSTKAGSSYEMSGIHIEGKSIDYPLDLNILKFDLFSSNSTIHTRSEGTGGLTLDLTSSEKANVTISGNITRGNTHGIAIPNWPTNGMINIHDFIIDRMSLDGVYLTDNLTVRIVDGSISQGGLVGIYAGEDVKLEVIGNNNPTSISNTAYGGIRMGKGSMFAFNNVNVSIGGGPGIVLGPDSVGVINDTAIYNCISGLTVGQGSDVEIYGIKVEYISQDYGMFAKNSDIVLGKGTDINYFRKGNGDGVVLEGGSLHINRTRIYSNSGEGLNLLGVKIIYMNEVQIFENNDNGLTMHITDEDLLDEEGQYCSIFNSVIRDNSGVGFTVTYDRSRVMKEIRIDVQGIEIGGNPGGDIISPREINIIWTSVLSDQDKLGSNTVTGFVRANLDIEVGESAGVEIRNLNITLLENNNNFHVSYGGNLNLVNCYIRPSQVGHRFSIVGDEQSTVIITGGYLGQLYRLEMDKGLNFYLDGTLVRPSEGAIRLESTPFNIIDSEISGVEGTALMVIDGEGRIEGTKFTDNTIGIQVEGLSDDLDIIDCEFTDNKWGISLFNDSSQMVSIENSYFSGNSPAPIWTATANAYVLDSFIDPNSIQVTQPGYSVRISYTLEVELKDEMGDDVEFDLRVSRGPGLNIVNIPNNVEKFSNSYESYQVRYDDIIGDYLTLEITLSYQEGLDTNDDPVIKEIVDTFDLDQAMQITYYGYQAPRKTAKFPGNLIAMEDIGLKDGVIDVETWFKDHEVDQGNLSFSAQQVSSQIIPHLDGSLLSLTLEKDWNGRGNITITATDPHGASLRLRVSINVLGTNDAPYAANPRIIALESDSPTVPRTHDTIKGIWEWFDVDGDPEPAGHIIRWYLNGTHMPDRDNKITVENVFAGQIWNFTLYPADNLGISGGIYGTPAHSPPIMVGNIPPRLNSASITTPNPTTLTDLMAAPGYWDDPETSVVTFNYLWEKKTTTGYESLGAPNSPILDHRFTTRGETIRVKVWVSDGFSISEVRTAEVYIRNSAPYITTATLMPELVDEATQRIYIDDLEWGDPDGDLVYISYQWYVRGYPISISETLNQIEKSQGNWNYPANITVGITPYDSNNLPGTTYFLSVFVTPTDTDGDGILDDANGNGVNDPNDDKDDDEDGFEDTWEEFLGTNPKDRFDKPMDSDGDGLPDGDPQNSKDWMDLDDDNDGIWDIHPQNADMSNPVWYDTFPKTASRPGDLDYDGIGDDQDPDMDDDGVPNVDDYAPKDDTIQNPPEEEGTPVIQILTFILLLLIIIAIAAFVYLVYNGTINLPTQAPPPVSDAGAEAIYEEDTGVAKLPPKIEDLDEMEEIKSMSTCSNCGELITADDLDCPNCGAEFEELEEEEEEDDDDEWEEE